MPRNFEWVPCLLPVPRGDFFLGGEERQADCSKRERDWLAAFRERADWLDLERGTDLIIRWHLFRSGLWSCDRILGPIGHSSFSHWPVGGAITITTFKMSVCPEFIIFFWRTDRRTFFRPSVCPEFFFFFFWRTDRRTKKMSVCLSGIYFLFFFDGQADGRIVRLSVRNIFFFFLTDRQPDKKMKIHEIFPRKSRKSKKCGVTWGFIFLTPTTSFHQVSWKSVQQLLCDLAQKQTNQPTNGQSGKQDLEKPNKKKVYKLVQWPFYLKILHVQLH